MTFNDAFEAAAALVEEETGRYDIARKIRALKVKE
jgi:hypothetical protein